MKKVDRKIILIGGAPTVGKSVMSEKVAKHFDLPWISTDQIREIMRLVGNSKDHPHLFDSNGHSAESFLNKYSAQEIADMEFKQGSAVWPGIKKMVTMDWCWRDGFVVEGVNILPHLVHKDFSESPEVKAVFMVDEDADRIREVVFTRGLFDDADKYSDDVKDKEVEWALLFSHKIKAEAEKHGYPCVEVDKGEDDLQKILSVVE